jgi:lysine-specific demethylase 3
VSVRGAQAKQQDGKEEEEPESVEIQGSKLEKPVQSCAWAASSDGSIKCPPLSQGGCGGCELALKSLFEPDWIAKLAMDAEMESYNTRTEHDPLHCSICDLGGGGGGGGDVKKKLRLASHRNGEKNDNYLYCPSRHNVEDESEGLVHFQKHWLRGEPVIVCDVVLEGGSGLSWEPMVMWRAVRETIRNKFEKNTRTVAAIDCLGWQEVEVNSSDPREGLIILCAIFSLLIKPSS